MHQRRSVNAGGNLVELKCHRLLPFDAGTHGLMEFRVAMDVEIGGTAAPRPETHTSRLNTSAPASRVVNVMDGISNMCCEIVVSQSKIAAL